MCLQIFSYHHERWAGKSSPPYLLNDQSFCSQNSIRHTMTSNWCLMWCDCDVCKGEDPTKGGQTIPVYLRENHCHDQTSSVFHPRTFSFCFLSAKLIITQYVSFVNVTSDDLFHSTFLFASPSSRDSDFAIMIVSLDRIMVQYTLTFKSSQTE
jgi:hypothetical protein